MMRAELGLCIQARASVVEVYVAVVGVERRVLAFSKTVEEDGFFEVRVRFAEGSFGLFDGSGSPVSRSRDYGFGRLGDSVDFGSGQATAHAGAHVARGLVSCNASILQSWSLPLNGQSAAVM